MQRTLIMIRHAKSSWANPLQSDFDRPLNERGKRDAPEMGKLLKETGIQPDLIISSTAKRTRQTTKRIAEALGYDFATVKWEEKLYHCVPSVFEELLYELEESVKTVIIVAHNPGITEFVNSFSPEFSIPNMPTCGVVGAQLEAADWGGYALVNKKVFLFQYPGKDDDTQ